MLLYHAVKITLNGLECKKQLISNIIPSFQFTHQIENDLPNGKDSMSNCNYNSFFVQTLLNKLWHYLASFAS